MKKSLLIPLIVLLLLGGALFYQLSRKDTVPAPGVPEINRYLMELPESTGWKLNHPISSPPGYMPHGKPGFLERHGWDRHIDRKNWYGMVTALAAGEDIFISLWTANDEVVKIEIGDVFSPEPKFKQMLFQRFPGLRERDLLIP